MNARENRMEAVNPRFAGPRVPAERPSGDLVGADGQEAVPDETQRGVRVLVIYASDSTFTFTWS